MAAKGRGLSPWRPAGRPALGKRIDRGSQLGTLGESILAALSVTSIHGTVNPSFLDLRYRSVDGGMRTEARRMLGLSLGIELAASAVIGWGFRNWIPGVVGVGSSLALYFMFIWALEAGPPPQTPQPK